MGSGYEEHTPSQFQAFIRARFAGRCFIAELIILIASFYADGIIVAEYGAHLLTYLHAADAFRAMSQHTHFPDDRFHRSDLRAARD